MTHLVLDNTSVHSEDKPHRQDERGDAFGRNTSFAEQENSEQTKNRNKQINKNYECNQTEKPSECSHHLLSVEGLTLEGSSTDV